MKKENAISWSDVRSREEHRRVRIFSGFVFLAICALLAGGAWTVIYSPLFRIKNIEIIGKNNVSRDDIMALATMEISRGSFWKRILGTENILTWPNDFSVNSLKLLPELKSVSIKKSYRQRKINIVVEEKKPFGVWCLRQVTINTDETQAIPDSSCFWFDSDGIIFKKAIGVEGNLITSLSDYSQKNIGLNSKIVPDEFIANIFSIFRAVSASGLSVKEIRLNDLAAQEIEVDTYDGPKIYFSLRFPADSVPGVIQSLKEKTTFGNLQYVDFRVENRVYYK